MCQLIKQVDILTFGPICLLTMPEIMMLAGEIHSLMNVCFSP